MWRRHANCPPPFHHALRTTCMELLPLVEMFCKWELLEECSNLRDLMLRFDSESYLESHELGRILLSMIRDDDDGFFTLPPHVPVVALPSPFDVVRERLSAAALAIQGLHAQVQLVIEFSC